MKAARTDDEVDVSACHAYTPVRNRRSFLYLENHSLDEWFSRYKKREAVTDFPILAPMRGFEPPTYRLGGGRSILLSYMGIWTFYSLGIVTQFQPLVNLESSSRSSVSVRSADTAFFRSV